MVLARNAYAFPPPPTHTHISTEGRELLLPRAIQSLFPLPFPQAKCDLSDWEDQENALWVLPLLKGPILWAHCQLPLPQKGGLAMASCVRVWVRKFSSGGCLRGASGWDLNHLLLPSFPVMKLVLISSWLAPALPLVTLSQTWTCSSLLIGKKKNRSSFME